MHVSTIAYHPSLSETSIVYHDTEEGGLRHFTLMEHTQWDDWIALHGPEVFRELHSFQHELLEIVREPGKGLGLRLKRAATAKTVIATGFGPLMTHKEEAYKLYEYESRFGINAKRRTYAIEVIRKSANHSEGYIDPSDQDYKLDISRANQVGLFWWANEPSGDEHCNVVTGTVKLSNSSFGVLMVTLQDLPAGTFIRSNYGHRTLEYTPALCVEGEYCHHCDAKLEFPLIHLDGAHLVVSPITKQPIVLSRRRFKLGYRPLQRTFTNAFFGYEKQYQQQQKRLKTSHEAIQFIKLSRYLDESEVQAMESLSVRWMGENGKDGEIHGPNKTVTKTWTFANNGQLEWPSLLYIKHKSGPLYDTIPEHSKVYIPFRVKRRSLIEIQFTFQTPNECGKYETEFVFVNNIDGDEFYPFWLKFNVQKNNKNTKRMKK